MAKKNDLSEADKIAFKEAMKGVKPLTHTKISPQKIIVAPLKNINKIQNEYNRSNLFQFSDHETLQPVGSEEPIEFSRAGIQYKILHKMRTGQYTIEARLDLHGMIIDKARDALSRFIAECSHKGIRYGLIIHGKSRANRDPILKNKLNHWLRQNSDILAFCSAKPTEGGTGAVYLLLKRRIIR
ncbi:MAG: smrA [Gammaproteobacteria bacterium]|jgi:DNA-nicking Smr family endonuclease|nr:smrA [Gammaproteobacteria bacterium]